MVRVHRERDREMATGGGTTETHISRSVRRHAVRVNHADAAIQGESEDMKPKE